MEAIITVLAALLLIVCRLLYVSIKIGAIEKTKNLRAQAEINCLTAHAACAQAEIRALEDKLREVNHGN